MIGQSAVGSPSAARHGQRTTMPLTIQHRGGPRRNDRLIEVFVDGQSVGEIEHGGELSIDVDDGVHTVRVSNRTDSSDTLSLLATRENQRVEVGLTMRGTDSTATILNRLIRRRGTLLRACSRLRPCVDGRAHETSGSIHRDPEIRLHSQLESGAEGVLAGVSSRCHRRRCVCRATLARQSARLRPRHGGCDAR